MEIKQEVACGVVPLFQDSGEYKFLLIRSLTGSWGFPKGHLETNESERDCALRELKEEVGLSAIIVENLVYEVDYFISATLHKKVKLFLGLIDLTKQTVKIQTEEIAEHKIVTASEAISLFQFDDLKSLMRKISLDLSNQ